MTRRRDPYLAAGYIWCETHQEYSLAVDAAWVGDDSLIASYAGCGCADQIWIIAPSKLTPSGRCEATTKAGRRCKCRAERNGFCYSHFSANKSATDPSIADMFNRRFGLG